MQRIWTPSRPARSISVMCLAILASRMVSSFSAVEQAWVAWISPHFTILGMSEFLDWFTTEARRHGGLGDSRKTRGHCGCAVHPPAFLREVFRALRASVVHVFRPAVPRMSPRYATKLTANLTNHAYAYKRSNRFGSATVPPGVTTARANPGITRRMAITKAAIARGFTPRR